MIKLKTYCNLFSGYSFRNKLTINENDSYKVIQLKDFNATYKEIDYLHLSTTSEFSSSNKYYLEDKDILLVARGNDNWAVLFEKDKCNERTIAAGAFIVIRPMRAYIDPAYLIWYLNMAESQASLKRAQVGTTVNSLSIKTLYEFEIKVPPLQKQQLIGKSYLLLLENKRISHERDEKWTQLVNEELKSIL